MNALRPRMTDAMNLAGLAPSTQQTYLYAVDRLCAHYWRSPEELSEQEVREYILLLLNNGAARGTFKTAHFGIQFLYENTLDRGWSLFLKKRSDSPAKNDSQESWPTSKYKIS